jgi:hypothetical protein
VSENYSDLQFHDLIESNQKLVTSVESLVRAIHGAPEEGNIGMLPRLQKIEKDHNIFRWAIPLAIFTGGTAGGILSKFLG